MDLPSTALRIAEPEGINDEGRVYIEENESLNSWRISIMSGILLSSLAATQSSGVVGCRLWPPKENRGWAQWSAPRYSLQRAGGGVLKLVWVPYLVTGAVTGRRRCPLPREPKPLEGTVIAISSPPAIARLSHGMLPG